MALATVIPAPFQLTSPALPESAIIESLPSPRLRRRPNPSPLRPFTLPLFFSATAGSINSATVSPSTPGTGKSIHQIVCEYEVESPTSPHTYERKSHLSPLKTNFGLRGLCKPPAAPTPPATPGWHWALGGYSDGEGRGEFYGGSMWDSASSGLATSNSELVLRDRLYDPSSPDWKPRPSVDVARAEDRGFVQGHCDESRGGELVRRFGIWSTGSTSPEIRKARTENDLIQVSWESDASPTAVVMDGIVAESCQSYGY